MKKKITIDFNRLSKAEFRQYFAERAKFRESLVDKKGRELTYLDSEMDQLDKFDFENLYARVITDWGYEGPVSYETYSTLGFESQRAIDQTVSELFEQLTKKN